MENGTSTTASSMATTVNESVSTATRSFDTTSTRGVIAFGISCFIGGAIVTYLCHNAISGIVGNFSKFQN